LALCSQKATEGALWVRQPALRGIAGPLLAGSQAALCGIVSLDRHQISTLRLHQEHKILIITIMTMTMMPGVVVMMVMMVMMGMMKM
jgi:hypothetical protein